jgi:hypothetical protein
MMVETMAMCSALMFISATKADRAGDKNERGIGPPRVGELQCLRTVEARQRVVG